MRASALFAIISAAAVGSAAAVAPLTVEPNAYVMVLKKDADDVAFKTWLAGQTAKNGQRVAPVRKSMKSVRGGLNAVSASFDESVAALIKNRPDVLAIVPNRIYQLQTVQTDVPTWGLPRISSIPNNSTAPGQTYSYPASAGAGVTAYILDSGIRTTHSEFEGRAKWGYTATEKGNDVDDNGHGTHVAGTVGGKTYGVAKKVDLVAVKICSVKGCSVESIVDGINWMIKDCATKQKGKCVANMSVGGPGPDAAMEAAVTAAVEAGVAFATSAGNSKSDACNFTPARTPTAFTIGATDNQDKEASYSNFGKCVDIYAPGTEITSAWNDSDSGSKTISGTSMASPHATGVLALVAGSGDFTPAQIYDKVTSTANKDVLTALGAESPNKLLYSTAESYGAQRLKY